MFENNIFLKIIFDINTSKQPNKPKNKLISSNFFISKIKKHNFKCKNKQLISPCVLL